MLNLYVIKRHDAELHTNSSYEFLPVNSIVAQLENIVYYDCGFHPSATKASLNAWIRVITPTGKIGYVFFVEEDLRDCIIH